MRPAFRGACQSHASEDPSRRLDKVPQQLCNGTRPAAPPSRLASGNRHGRRGSSVRLHHRDARLAIATTETVMAANATKVSTALTACENSHCWRAASKSDGVTVQL